MFALSNAANLNYLLQGAFSFTKSSPLQDTRLMTILSANALTVDP
jgi:hypothetical protein